MIELNGIIIDFLLWTIRRIREFDLKLIFINIVRFSHVKIMKDLFVKLMIIFSEIIIFSFIKSLHFNSFIKWNSRLIWLRTFFSIVISFRYKSNMMYELDWCKTFFMSRTLIRIDIFVIFAFDKVEIRYFVFINDIAHSMSTIFSITSLFNVIVIHAIAYW
jgi:hypothetical protein